MTRILYNMYSNFDITFNYFFWRGTMSFREKSAWITLVSVLLCFGVYFGALATGRIDRFGMSGFHFALISIIALVVLQVVLRVAVALGNLREARAPRDEREQLFELRARSLGYYVLMLWMAGIIVAVHFPGMHKLDVVYIAWLGVAVAIVIVSVAQIIQYRRGS
jgi:cytochrome b561